MFESFHNLRENPFSLTPDPRYVFPSKSHDEAMAHLRYWIQHHEGFVLITGEVGTGKTTALFSLLETLERRYDVALIDNSTLSPLELLEEVCRRFGIEIPDRISKPALLARLEGHCSRLVERGQGALILIDEAQNFDRELLEEIRLLSNMTRAGEPLALQIALVGQPELERRLANPTLRQLRQRIGLHYRIEPLTETEAVRYVQHRVTIAGGDPVRLFPDETLRAMYEATHGLPREINQIASQALVHAYVDRSPVVLPAHVRSAMREMRFESVLAPIESEERTKTPEPAPPPRVVEPTRPPRGIEPTPPPREVEPVSTPTPAPAPAPVVPSPPEEPAPAVEVEHTTARRDAVVVDTPPPPPAPVPLPVPALWPSYGEETESPGRKRRPSRIAFLGVAVVVLVLLGMWWRSRAGNSVARDEGSSADTTAAVTSDSSMRDVVAAYDNAPRAAAPTAPSATSALRGIPSGPYRLQVSSVHDSVAADAVGQRLATLTRLRYDVVADREGPTPWFAVVLGPFRTLDEAEAARAGIQSVDPDVRGTVIRTSTPE